jgi:hypothetical protein
VAEPCACPAATVVFTCEAVEARVGRTDSGSTDMWHSNRTRISSDFFFIYSKFLLPDCAWSARSWDARLPPAPRIPSFALTQVGLLLLVFSTPSPEIEPVNEHCVSSSPHRSDPSEGARSSGAWTAIKSRGTTEDRRKRLESFRCHPLPSDTTTRPTELASPAVRRQCATEMHEED